MRLDKLPGMRANKHGTKCPVCHRIMSHIMEDGRCHLCFAKPSINRRQNGDRRKNNLAPMTVIVQQYGILLNKVINDGKLLHRCFKVNTLKQIQSDELSATRDYTVIAVLNLELQVIHTFFLWLHNAWWHQDGVMLTVDELILELKKNSPNMVLKLIPTDELIVRLSD